MDNTDNIDKMDILNFYKNKIDYHLEKKNLYKVEKYKYKYDQVLIGGVDWANYKKKAKKIYNNFVDKIDKGVGYVAKKMSNGVNSLICRRLDKKKYKNCKVEGYKSAKLDGVKNSYYYLKANEKSSGSDQLEFFKYYPFKFKLEKIEYNDYY
jgi:hypothetical protein